MQAAQGYLVNKVLPLFTAQSQLPPCKIGVNRGDCLIMRQLICSATQAQLRCFAVLFCDIGGLSPKNSDAGRFGMIRQ